jgi:Core-2/I-Branching enzyme
MNLVYLVVSHRGPDQVLRLVRALRESPSATVVVRHDQRHSRLDAAALERAGAVALSVDIVVEWGGWSHLRMLLGALARIVAEHDPDWVVVLSGQDYPLRPLDEVEHRLATAGRDAFLAAAWELPTDTLPPPPAEEFFLRYAYLHLRTPLRLPYLPGRLKPVVYVRETPRRLGIRRPRLPFGEAMQCWVSSDWPTLNRRALETVLRTAREERRLIRHYRRTVAPAESFFATALMNDRRLSVSGEDSRVARFSPQSPHPDVLTSKDLDELTASGAQFARKFDSQVDERVLDRLDEVRHSRSPR